MNITSQGTLTAASATKFVRYLAQNETMLAEAVKFARGNLPEFIDKAFKLPPETRQAFRQIMTPEMSDLLINFVLQAIRSDDAFEISVEPAEPDKDGNIALAISMEVVTKVGPTSGSASGASASNNFKVKCKPEDGSGHPNPGQ